MMGLKPMRSERISGQVEEKQQQQQLVGIVAWRERINLPNQEPKANNNATLARSKPFFSFACAVFCATEHAMAGGASADDWEGSVTLTQAGHADNRKKGEKIKKNKKKEALAAQAVASNIKPALVCGYGRTCP